MNIDVINYMCGNFDDKEEAMCAELDTAYYVIRHLMKAAGVTRLTVPDSAFDPYNGCIQMGLSSRDGVVVELIEEDDQ